MTWTAKQLRGKGRTAVSANYLQCVLAGLIVLFLLGETGFIPPAAASAAGGAPADGFASALRLADAASVQLSGAPLPIPDAARGMGQSTIGLLATLFAHANAAGSLLFGALDAVNRFALQNSISGGAIALLGTAIAALYAVFVKNILRVGQARFFLENRRYSGTRPERLLLVYRARRTRNVAFAMLCRSVFTTLWFFTVVGGFVALYAYRMVPFILAENPSATWRDALACSRRLMAGQKWRAFLFDCTFLGWGLLNALTFGVLRMLYVGPYKAAADAELYMALREAELSRRPEASRILCDAQLAPAVAPPPGSGYPAEAFHIPAPARPPRLALDCRRRYTLTDYILLFFTFCLIGYLFEVLYVLIGNGVLVNRGTLFGPWLPLYGVCGLAMLFLLRGLVGRPVVLFFACMALCGVIEYLTAWYLETFKHAKWWDYTGFFLNIQGRVCLEGLLAFAALGTLTLYVVAPLAARLYGRLPRRLRVGLCAGLLVLFAADVVYSQFFPNLSSAFSMA